MKRYEYQFVDVSAKRGLKDQAGDTFDACKHIIADEAENGWRLKQVVTPFHEKLGVYRAMGYQIIFERELETNSGLPDGLIQIKGEEGNI